MENNVETLLPVIIGGLIGLAGGIVGPPLAHWLSEGSSNRKKRAEKLEEMIGYIYAHDHWLDMIRNIRVFGAQDNQEPAPLPRAMAIAVIYFPQFTTQLNALHLSANHYGAWMLQQGLKRLAGETKNLAEGHEAAYQPYLLMREGTLEKLKAYAASEFAAISLRGKRADKGSPKG